MDSLADRIEALDGPDREIDARIQCAVSGDDFDVCVAVVPDFTQWNPLPRFSASVDAALTLVLDGVRIGNLSQHDHKKLRAKGEWLCTLYEGGKIDDCLQKPVMWGRCQYAATPALAICAAALRAREQDT